jgi:Flp pilus assembly protein TadG
MIDTRRRTKARRLGGSFVEVPLVMIVFLMFLFGVFEYCRFIFCQQLVENAAREGARYAVVNTSDTNLVADTQAVVTKYMAGQTVNMPITTTVYLSDSSGNNIGSPTNAAFGQFIAVQVSGTYQSMVPMIHLGNVTIQSRILMCSEAN